MNKTAIDTKSSVHLLTNSDITDIFSEAANVDPTLEILPVWCRKLQRKWVPPTPYSRKSWLTSMATNEMSLFSDYPPPTISTQTTHKKPGKKRTTDFMERLARWNPNRTFHVQTGRSATVKYLSFPEIHRRWSGNRAVVSATDIHLRETTLSKLLDLDALTHVNLLPQSGAEAQALEMLAMVISTRHNLTDSHSDDLDGSNYCFQGKKLWLAWDTHEGHKAGLEDCDRDYVPNDAKFDMGVFLSLKSAKWFLVTDGQMLFLPGHYAHKVFTLERYIGVGGFYVALPNVLSTVSRWESKGANWQTGESETSHFVEIDQIIDVVERTLAMKSKTRRKELGGEYVNLALEHWSKKNSKRKFSKMIGTSRLLGLME